MSWYESNQGSPKLTNRHINCIKFCLKLQKVATDPTNETDGVYSYSNKAELNPISANDTTINKNINNKLITNLKDWIPIDGKKVK